MTTAEKSLQTRCDDKLKQSSGLKSATFCCISPLSCILLLPYLIFCFAIFIGRSAHAQAPDCPPGHIRTGDQCFPIPGMVGQLSADPEGCGSARYSYLRSKELLEFARRNIANGQATHRIRVLRDHARKCDVDLLKNFGVSESQLNQWERQSQLSRLSRLESEIAAAKLVGQADTMIREHEALAPEMSQSNRQMPHSRWREENQKAQEAEAKTCSAVDLRRDFGPVRDQGSIGWCYAYVAADLISYRMGQRVSAIDVAVNYNESSALNAAGKFLLGRPESAHDGGFVADALSSTIQKGICLEDKLPSDDSKHRDLRTSIEAVEQIKSVRRKQGLAGDRLPDCDLSSFRTLFPNVDLRDLLHVLEASSKHDFFRTLVDKACEPRIKPNREMKVEKINFRWASPQERVEKFKQVDQQLTEKNPVGVSVGSKLFGIDDISGHAMTLVGRKWDPNKKQCLYIIRNSWGPSCYGLNSRVEGCEDGNIFVSKHQLLQHLRVTDHLKP